MSSYHILVFCQWKRVISETLGSLGSGKTRIKVWVERGLRGRSRGLGRAEYQDPESYGFSSNRSLVVAEVHTSGTLCDTCQLSLAATVMTKSAS